MKNLNDEKIVVSRSDNKDYVKGWNDCIDYLQDKYNINTSRTLDKVLTENRLLKVENKKLKTESKEFAIDVKRLATALISECDMLLESELSIDEK